MGLHVNPLRKKHVMVANSESGTMTEEEQPMSYRDAAIVSTILTVWQIFVSFLTQWGFDQISADFCAFIYKLFLFTGCTWMGFFVILTGLATFYSR